MTTLDSSLDLEIEARAKLGLFPRTVKQINESLSLLGYKLDRSKDCKSVAKIIAGERAGNTYPCMTTGICEIDTGLSFANVNARRDQNFKTLQAMRSEGTLFAVVNGSILEV